MSDTAYLSVVALIAVLLGVTVPALPLIESTEAIAATVCLGGVVYIYRRFLVGVPVWAKALSFVAWGQVVLGYAFANLVIPLGPLPLPLSELTLCLALYMGYRAALRRRTPAYKIPLLMWIIPIWVTWNLAWHVPAGVAKGGIEGVRDALPTLELMFIVGFYFVATYFLEKADEGRAQLMKFCLSAVIFSAFYQLLFPAEGFIRQISPVVPGPSRSVPLFGTFGTATVSYLGVFAIPLWLWQNGRAPIPNRHKFIAAVTLISGVCCYIVAQGRAAYVFFAFAWVLILLSDARKSASKILVGAITVGLVFFGTLDLFNIEIQGRISTISLTGVFKHIASLDGKGGGQEFAGAANGISQRKEWRETALRYWKRDASTVLLGSGFGIALTDLITYGDDGQIIIVREPHNSYISTLSRSGLLGLATMLYIHITTLIYGFQGYLRHKRTRKTMAAAYTFALLYEIFSLMDAWGQPYFENPYFAISAYFVVGLIYAMHYQDNKLIRRGGHLQPMFAPARA